MTRSAPGAFDWNSSVTALLIIGWIRWLGPSFLMKFFGCPNKFLELRRAGECPTGNDDGSQSVGVDDRD